MNFEFGKEYSVAELRKIFNLPQKTGAMAMQQIKDLSKTYNLEKVKRGVYKILSEKSLIDKIETQVYNKNRDYIEPMVYEMLNNAQDNVIVKDMHELMTATQIVNQDFNYIKWHTKECAEIMSIEETGLSIFTKESEPMLKRIIKDVLYEMQDKQLILVEEIPVVAYKVYNADTKHWFTRLNELTTISEKQNLLEIKRKLLLNLGLTKESELKFYENGQFRDMIAKEYNASYFYYKYKIILNKKGLTECSNCDIIELKKSFNKYIQGKLAKSKQGGLKDLNDIEKDIYIKYCIDTSKDYRLRYRKEK